MTASFYEERRCHGIGIGVDCNFAGVVDVDVCIFACGDTGLAGIDVQVVTLQINYHVLIRVVVGNYCVYACSSPTAEGYSATFVKSGFCFREYILASICIKNATFYISKVIISIAGNRSVKSILRLYEVSHPIKGTLTGFFIKLNFAKSFSYRCGSQTFCNLHSTGKVAFAFYYATIFFVNAVDVAGVEEFACHIIKHLICKFSISYIDAFVVGNQGNFGTSFCALNGEVPAYDINRGSTVFAFHNFMVIKQSGVTIEFAYGYIYSIVVAHVNIASIASKFTNFRIGKVSSTGIGRSPHCFVFEAHNEVFIILRIAVPSCTAVHYQISCITCVALPFSAITHPEIQYTIIARSYTKTRTCTVVTIPVGIFSVQPDVDDAISTHTAYGREVTGDLGSQIACASCFCVSSFTFFSNVYVYDTPVFRYKFAISTNCKRVTATKVGFTSAVIGCKNFTAAYFDSRCYCRNCFTCTTTIGYISKDIYKTINFNPRTTKRTLTIHCFHQCTVTGRGSPTTNGYNFIFKVFTTILNVENTATICIKCCSLTSTFCININSTSVNDVNLTTTNSSNTYNGARLFCMNAQIIAVHINVKCFFTIGRSNSCSKAAKPRTSYNIILFCSANAGIFSKAIYATAFINAIVNIFAIFSQVTTQAVYEFGLYLFNSFA